MAEANNVTSMNVTNPDVYKGHYLDIFGYRGEIRLSLTGSAEIYSGSCELVIAGNHEPLVFRGNAEAIFQEQTSLESTSGILRLDLEIDDEDEPGVELIPETKKFSAESSVLIRSVDSYAKRVIYGVIPANPSVGLGGGVWVAWHYARKN